MSSAAGRAPRRRLTSSPGGPRPKWTVVLLALLCILRADARDDGLEALREARQSDVYAPPGEAMRRAARRLFALLLQRPEPPPGDIRGAAAAAGMDLLEVDEAGARLFVVADPPGHLRGSGVYAVRREGGRPWLLQAPHSSCDALTGTIALKLLREGDAAAAAWNSARRDARVEGAGGGAGAGADLAHTDGSLFEEFAMAFAEAHPECLVVQLHGFDQARRATEAARAAAAIVSDGTTKPAAWLAPAAAALGAALAERVAAFPADAGELGGTTNTVGKALRSAAGARFLHVELSLPLRRRLRSEAEARRALLSALPHPRGKP